MTEVYFIRHAQSDHSVKDNLSRPLTAKGLEDSKKVTAFLAGKKIDRIYSSPCRRAVETVSDFAQKSGLKISMVEDFKERIISGEWIDDYEAYARLQWADFDYKKANGESLREVQARNIKALQTVLIENAGGAIAVATHGTALSTIINYYKPDFLWDDFARIVHLTPFIVKMEFEKLKCLKIEEFCDISI